MERTKMALGMVVGAVLLHLGFAACEGPGRGMLGGRSAQAQDAAAPTPPPTGACAQWDVMLFNLQPYDAYLRLGVHLPAGWEPFAPASPTTVFGRRCIVTSP